MDLEGLELVAETADIMQIGARSMQNYPLLKECGRLRQADPAEARTGGDDHRMAAVGRVHPGAKATRTSSSASAAFASFDTTTRNLFDLAAIAVVHGLSHLPIIADPSHGTGHRDMVPPMARAAVAAGADGLLIEVHPDPDRAMSDGAQSLYPEQFERMMREVAAIAEVIGRSLRNRGLGRMIRRIAIGGVCWRWYCRESGAGTVRRRSGCGRGQAGEPGLSGA